MNIIQVAIHAGIPRWNSPKLSSTNFPKVTYWTKTSYLASTNSKSSTSGYKDKTSKGKGRDVKVPLYLEHATGALISVDELKQVYALARMLFHDAKRMNEAPSSWGNVGLNLGRRFEEEMTAYFPFLAYGEFNWKAHQIATDNYPSWRTTHLLGNISSVKVEEDPELNNVLKCPVDSSSPVSPPKRLKTMKPKVAHSVAAAQVSVTTTTSSVQTLTSVFATGEAPTPTAHAQTSTLAIAPSKTSAFTTAQIPISTLTVPVSAPAATKTKTSPLSASVPLSSSAFVAPVLSNALVSPSANSLASSDSTIESACSATTAIPAPLTAAADAHRSPLSMSSHSVSAEAMLDILNSDSILFANVSSSFPDTIKTGQSQAAAPATCSSANSHPNRKPGPLDDLYNETPIPKLTLNETSLSPKKLNTNKAKMPALDSTTVKAVSKRHWLSKTTDGKEYQYNNWWASLGMEEQARFVKMSKEQTAAAKAKKKKDDAK
ncbi:hypothetical protein BDP27DRAFT_1456633 [Rhodocollybia butyracea]|uniref:Uncharacterized protein n=1 Tax=Rhodocollybia butyracea TaxID=206335 RepID=A0A9P5P4V8_9AGAR|nr:hypothetical protein BDP27DRAFT_1456633 [Rhodocollybia butyracea]